MTPIMPEQLEAIRQRTEKASAGPWITNTRHVYASTELIGGVYPSVVCEDASEELIENE